MDDRELSPRLHELVTINTDSNSDDNYARITLDGPSCPFLAEGLCSIQKKLGEEYLSMMCSAYPRVMNVVDDVLQRSLDLSCPEAARITLLDPNPMQFDEEEGPAHDERLGNLSLLKTTNGESDKPYQYFREIRGFVIWLLQYRAYPLSKRLVLLGSLCDQLQQTAATDLSEVLDAYRDGVERDLFGEALATHRTKPAAQLELVLELIVGRISSDFTAPRLLACYQKFMQAMEWTTESSMTDIGRRYAAAYTQSLPAVPKPTRAHAGALPGELCSPDVVSARSAREHSGGISIHRVANTIRDQCLLMLAYYAIVQTLLIGMAAFHREQFGTAEAIQVIQSFTKAFEHSTSFPERALKILAEKGIQSCASLAILLLN